MGNSTFKTPEQYLFNTAKHVLGQIGSIDIDEVGVHFTSDEFPVQFWSTYGGDILNALSGHGPEALGRIAAASPGHLDTHSMTHWDMNQGKCLNNAGKGGSTLLLLAAYCVAAKIANMVRQDLLRKETSLGAKNRQTCWACGGTGDDPATAAILTETYGQDVNCMPCNTCDGFGEVPA